MAAFSDFLETAILNEVFGQAAFSSPNLWMLLADGAISDADTGTTVESNVEITGTGYARVQASAAAWSSAVAGTIGAVLSVAVSFPSSTGNWGTVTYWGLASASTAGNLLCFASVETAQAVASDTIVTFADGSISVTMS